MNNKISNVKTEVPQTKEMNDKDYLASILSLEKAMVKDYAVSITEASNLSLYDSYYEMLGDVSKIQREIFNLMFKKGWYALEMAEENKISEKLTNLSEEAKQLQK